MSNLFQWILAVLSFLIAITIIVFGIAGIAVAIGFLMIPGGIFYIVRAVKNLMNNTKTVITVELNRQNQIIINPFLELVFGILLLFIGVTLTDAFIGIVLTGVGIFLVIYFLDKFFNKR